VQEIDERPIDSAKGVPEFKTAADGSFGWGITPDVKLTGVGMASSAALQRTYFDFAASTPTNRGNLWRFQTFHRDFVVSSAIADFQIPKEQDRYSPIPWC
jgi:hypothetical protein